MTARYVVHQMIQDLMRDPLKARAFSEDPEATFEAYGLSDAEKVLLRQATLPALHELGVHPNLQMKYAKLRKVTGTPGGGRSPLGAYLDRLLER